jgi:very-short-patch-repair endonuclease
MSATRARTLRKQSTWAEKQLWRLLRSRRLAGYKFRRQHPEKPYYLDVYCVEAKLAIELDGSGHGFPSQQACDFERDSFLASHGILVKRVWNHQLAKSEDRNTLLENLWRLLQEHAPHPGNVAPLPHRREPDKPKIPSP